MFEPIQLGTNHMLGADAYVPQMKQNFEIRVYDSDGGAATDFSNVLTLSTAEVGAIQEEQDVITVHYGNGIIKFPNKVSFNDVDWTLNCYCSPDVVGALKKWRDSVFDAETEKMGIPSEYGKMVYFIRYDGRGTAKSVIKCPFTWIKGLNYGDYNPEGGLVQVTTTFVISKAIYMTPDQF